MKPMQIDQAATETARERHEHGIWILDNIFNYDRGTGSARRAPQGPTVATRMSKDLWNDIAKLHNEGWKRKAIAKRLDTDVRQVDAVIASVDRRFPTYQEAVAKGQDR